MMIVASSRLVAAARYGGNTRDARRRGGAADPNAESEWMDKARKLANQRAARFRQERGAQPVAPAGWRRRRKPKKDGDFDEYAGAARGYDDVPGPGRRVDADEMEMTATAGDGLWRVDMAGLSEEDWATQWTMTAEEFAAVKRDVKANARDPIAALRAFEDAGLRRISPDIAAEMLRVIADKAKSARVDREELAGVRRDARFAHLLGTCVAAARRGSDALSAGGVAGATWALAVIAGERANSAEMEVLSDRAAALVDDMSPRQCADLSWALASCRHAAPAAFGALGVFPGRLLLLPALFLACCELPIVAPGGATFREGALDAGPNFSAARAVALEERQGEEVLHLALCGLKISQCLVSSGQHESGLGGGN